MRYKTLTHLFALLAITFIFQSCQKGGTHGCAVSTVTDIDGNVYHAVTIGNQCWMQENLQTTRFRDGSPIGELQDSVLWKKIHNDDTHEPAWCNYNSDTTNRDDYGNLYNWFAVSDSRGVCPTGWHVPSDDEWIELTDYLGAGVAGGKLKSTSSLWLTPNTGADNSSDFTAEPGGYRHYNAKYTGLGEQAYWWTATEEDAEYVRYHTVFYNYASASRNINRKADAMSVRCVAD